MNAELLKDGIASLGGTVTEQQIGQFAAYAAQLWEWNQKINLTAIVDPDGIAVKHFLDSILPLFYVPFPKDEPSQQKWTQKSYKKRNES